MRYVQYTTDRRYIRSKCILHTAHLIYCENHLSEMRAGNSYHNCHACIWQSKIARENLYKFPDTADVHVTICMSY